MMASSLVLGYIIQVGMRKYYMDADQITVPLMLINTLIIVYLLILG